MRRFVDLHTHSTASDGSVPPDELVRLAEARRLAAVALTDHDTTDGLAAAGMQARSFPKLMFVNGIECSGIFPSGTLHILGLGIDENDRQLRGLLQSLRAARRQRNPKIIAALQQLGVNIDMNDVMGVASDMRRGRRERIIGRLHIAETLRRKGYVRDHNEAFAKYIGTGAAAYVDKEHLTPRQVIAAIRSARGLAVLAHPVQLNCENRAQLDRVVRSLVTAGLEGIEAYHTDHTPAQTRAYLDLARRYGLAVTGGSDFHGEAKAKAILGRPRVPVAAVGEQLLERLGRL